MQAVQPGAVPLAQGRARSIALGWILGVGALPLIELGFLSVRFDSSDLVARGGDLGRLVAATGDVVRAAVPLLAALALVVAARIDRLTAALEPALAGRRRAGIAQYVNGPPKRAERLPYFRSPSLAISALYRSTSFRLR